MTDYGQSHSTLTQRQRLHVAAGEGAARFVAHAAFPKLAYRLSLPLSAGPRGLALYVALHVGQALAIQAWVVPRVNRWVEERKRMNAELSGRLGREPTSDEWFEYLRESSP